MKDRIQSRRDFIRLTASAAAAVGAGLNNWPLLGGRPSAWAAEGPVSVEVDLEPIEVGQRITVQWDKKQVFIAHRTPAEIEAARSVDLSTLPDPEDDRDRVQRPEWLVVVGICTHAACIPIGQDNPKRRGPQGGWRCPCHGAVFDTSGRIRRGLAPRNLEVPDYTFLDDQRLRIE